MCKKVGGENLQFYVKYKKNSQFYVKNIRNGQKNLEFFFFNFAFLVLVVDKCFAFPWLFLMDGLE